MLVVSAARGRLSQLVRGARQHDYGAIWTRPRGLNNRPTSCLRSPCASRNAVASRGADQVVGSGQQQIGDDCARW